MLNMHTSSHTYYPGHESRISSSQNHQTAVQELCRLIPDSKLYDVLKQIQTEFSSDTYRLELLLEKFRSFYKQDLPLSETYSILERACVELVSKEAPDWEMIAARFLSLDIRRRVELQISALSFSSWHEKLSWLRLKDMSVPSFWNTTARMR